MRSLRTPLPTGRPPNGLAPVPGKPLQAVARSTESAKAAGRRERVVRISCVLPCRNEAGNLALLLPLLGTALAELTPDWEIVLVDDGSTDGTAALLDTWSQRPGFKAIQLSRNFGKEAAMTAGLQAARGDVVVLMDADLQHPPALIQTLLEHWRRGADTVYAVRTDRSGEGAVKRWGTRLFYALVNAADRFEVPANAGDFRLMDRAVVDVLLALPERNRFMKGLYAWVGFEAVAVPYVPQQRASGSSHFNLWRLLRLSLDGLTSFTTWPLRAVSVTGFVLALLGFAYGAWLGVSYMLFGHPVSGWTTIVICVLFFCGVQLISLGIVGEYVGRVFEEVKGRPLFVVKRTMGHGLEEPSA